MKLSERWSQRANKHGLHSEDKRLALLCLDAVHDIALLEAENERLREFAQDMIRRAGYDISVDEALGGDI